MASSHDLHGRKPTGNVLPAILMSDGISAVITAAAVSPAVAIIDRSIIASVSGKQPLKEGLKDGLKTLLSRPWMLARQPSVIAVFCVYASTYACANSIESIVKHQNKDPTLPKFLISSTVNISATIWKDRLLTRWFGNTTPRPLPSPSYLLFGLRDSMTMAASFTLPPLLSQSLQHPVLSIPKPTADVIAQLTLPCAIQLVSTPIHLLGLDFYNRPGAEGGGMEGRLRTVGKGYVSATLARMGRILPAFGIGGVVNRSCRTFLEKRFSGDERVVRVGGGHGAPMAVAGVNGSSSSSSSSSFRNGVGLAPSIPVMSK
ncbi:hypothetical protein HDU97_006160 [Phlyctochytrium planicorne]|nr:hypothetical protein HDU97_006160 [Phlyctochytrium planicorne]